jgi:hypothetical protein
MRIWLLNNRMSLALLLLLLPRSFHLTQNESVPLLLLLLPLLLSQSSRT